MQRAIRQPISTIVANAGLEPAVIVEKVSSNKDPSFGYDALKNCYVNMIEAGIIGFYAYSFHFHLLPPIINITDPTKVIRTALQDASGVASLLATTVLRSTHCDFTQLFNYRNV